MKIDFRNEKFRKICEDKTKLIRKYGSQRAEEIITRINELDAAENLYDISKIPQARLHLLRDNLKGHFAVDVKHPKRLVLLPLNGKLLDKKSITAIKIITVINYH